MRSKYPGAALEAQHLLLLHFLAAPIPVYTLIYIEFYTILMVHYKSLSHHPPATFFYLYCCATADAAL